MKIVDANIDLSPLVLCASVVNTEKTAETRRNGV